MNYRFCTLVSIAMVGALAGPAPASAQEYQVGDRVMCQSSPGTVVRIDPRVGWDTPFYVVHMDDTPDGWTVNCTTQMLKVIAAAAPPRQQTPAPAPTKEQANIGQAAPGKGFGVGKRVMCQSSPGTVVRIDPRPGWDTPFYVVHLDGTPDSWTVNCTEQMLKANGAPPPQRQQALPPQRQETTVPHGGPGLCKPGAKLEGRWGTPWYDVTVLGPPDAAGNCPVRFDGYGAMWDNSLSSDLLRPRGGGQVQRPTNRVADTPAGDVANGRVPDGSYECVKDVGDGQSAHIGTLRVQGGRATLIGKPAGWTMTSLYMGGTDPWGKRIAVYEFTTPTGRDRLDCTRP